MDDLLARIDAATAPVCGWCSQPLPVDGVSLDFCDQHHQTLWWRHHDRDASDIATAHLDDDAHASDADATARSSWEAFWEAFAAPFLSSVNLRGGQLLYNAHPRSRCAGRPCCVHAPSRHHMFDWRQHWRSDRQLMERICPHGVGHPDPDHIAYLRDTTNAGYASSAGVHGCDGCCRPPQPEGTP